LKIHEVKEKDKGQEHELQQVVSSRMKRPLTVDEELGGEEETSRGEGPVEVKRSKSDSSL
jgi:hypothetical protein